MTQHYVYLLISRRDNSWYIGRTDRHPDKRLEEHNAGASASTDSKKPFDLVYYEMYTNVSDAFGREKFLKSGSGRRYLKKQLSHFLTSHRGVEQPGSSSGS